MKRLFLFVGMVLSLSTPCLWAHPFSHPQTWGDPKIEEILKTGSVAKIVPMKQALQGDGKTVEFDGAVFLVTLQSDQGPIQAVFKRCDPKEEWDHWGIECEVAAFKVSRVLGFPRVPPTVLRTINNYSGSLQLFVPTSIDLLKPKDLKQCIQAWDPDDDAALKIFYFVFGQWDAGPHNVLAYQDPQSKKVLPIAIDNANMRYHQRVQYGDLPFILCCASGKVWNQKDLHTPFPFHKVEILTDLSPEKMMAHFGSALTPGFCKQFGARRKSMKYVRYRNRIWIQYGIHEDFKPFSEHCPAWVLASLKKLDRKALQEIFEHSQKSEFLTEEYLDLILDRRDQVVQFFENPPKKGT